MRNRISHFFEKKANKKKTAAAVGIRGSSLQYWVDRLLSDDPTGSLTVHQLWAVLCGRSVAVQGESTQTAIDVTAYLSSLPADDIVAQIRAGRTCLLIVCGQVCPSLFPRADLLAGEHRALVRDMAAEGVHVAWRIVDVAPLLHEIIGEVLDADTSAPVNEALN